MAQTIAGTLHGAPAKTHYARRACSVPLLALLVFARHGATAQAQPKNLNRLNTELSTVVQVDEADHAAVALLELAKAQIGEHQWSEALEKLRQVDALAGSKLIKVDNHRFAPLREYCQLLIGRFSPEGLAAYRQSVDPMARAEYETALASRDARQLEKMLEDYFNSSYGDDALLSLGDIALEQGQPQRARAYWERISHKFRPAGSLPLSLGYPDTDLNLADIYARLILASIQEGDLRRARYELKELLRQHANAKGKLAGREVVYANALAELIEAAGNWPESREPTRGWSTFAGAPTRQYIAPQELKQGTQLAAFEVPTQNATTSLQSASDDGSALSLTFDLAATAYFPVVNDKLLLFNTSEEIFAYRADTGLPVWNGDAQNAGRIFFSGQDLKAAAHTKTDKRNQASKLGSPHHTLTVCDRWLLAQMGEPANTAPLLNPVQNANATYMICLDLLAEGRLNWKLTPEERGWFFEGSPICDGTNLYVAMRQNDGTGAPRQHIACFDLQSGTQRWRQFVCAAQAISHTVPDEAAHNLLTLTDETLYFNTNLGAVAALNTQDGKVRWLTTYARSPNIDVLRAANYGLNPALYHRGRLFVAPVDSTVIMMLDAFTGQVIWENDVPDDSIEYLLGVSGSKLWASGKSLWALDTRSGNVEYHSAVNTVNAKQRSVLGHGRGLLAAANVYWPVRVEQIENEKQHTIEHQIRVFDAQTARELPPIELGKLDPPCESGNLIMADNHLVIASPNRITLFKLPKSADDQQPPRQANDN